MFSISGACLLLLLGCSCLLPGRAGAQAPAQAAGQMADKVPAALGPPTSGAGSVADRGADDGRAPAAPAVFVGQVGTANGPLPGAVVRLAGSKEGVVTDAEGYFHVTLPRTGGPVRATVSYAGYADEPVVLDPAAGVLTLKTSRLIVVSRNQTLKAYQKNARKQVGRSLKSVRKANK